MRERLVIFKYIYFIEIRSASMQLILVNQNSWLQIDFLFYFSLPLALCHVNDDRVFGATLKKKLISVILRLNSKYYFKKKGKPKLLPQLLQATLYKM